MAHTTATPLFGPPTLSLDAAQAWATKRGARGKVGPYFAGLWKHGTRSDVKLNPHYLAGQFADETANGASLQLPKAVRAGAELRWLAEDNPAGIGIWGGSAPNPFNRRLTGEEIAMVHIAEVLAHTTGAVPTDLARLAREVEPTHYARVERLRNTHVNWPEPAVWTLQDLRTPLGGGDYVWAANQQYAVQIAAKMDDLALFQKEPLPVPTTDQLNMTPGLIPLPDHDDTIIDVSRRNQSSSCRGYDYLGARPPVPEFLVLHKSQCPPEASNLGYFQSTCCPALTDLEVVATSADMNWFVRRVAKPQAPSGWANGVVSQPYGDALKYLQIVGNNLNAVNRDGEAIEVTGWFAGGGETRETTVSDGAMRKIAQWMASRAHDYGIKWFDFPIVRKAGHLLRSYITWHEEWTIGTGKRCPGTWLKNNTERLIAMAKEIMRQYQTKGIKPADQPKPVPVVQYAPVVSLPFMLVDLRAGHPRNHRYDGLLYEAHLQEYTATKPTRRLQDLDTSKAAKVVGPKIEEGETFTTWYKVRKGKQTFVVTPWGTRVATGGLVLAEADEDALRRLQEDAA